MTDATSSPGRSDRYLAVVLALFAALVGVWAGRLVADVRGNVTDLTWAALAAALAAGMLTVALRRFVVSGPRAARRTFVACALVLIVSGVSALASDSSSEVIDKTRYVTADSRIVNSLRSLPGAHVVRRSDLPYFSGDNAGDPASGYTTLVRYRVPGTLTSAQITAFYRRALGGRWRLIETIPANTRDGPVVNFVRGTATLSINLMNERRHQVEISVDHHHSST